MGQSNVRLLPEGGLAAQPPNLPPAMSAATAGRGRGIRFTNVDSVLRILDANANRAREALRVMEEAARFRLGDGELVRGIKQARHDLASVMLRFDGLEFHRDTPGDVGTSIKTGQEQQRTSILEVAIAAGKRLSEALRVIEEYGKVIDPGYAAAIESLRYRGYELEKRLNLALGTGQPAQWKVCVILTASLCSGGDWWETAHAVLDAGADCIQLREKELDDASLLRRAISLRGMTGGQTLIINDRPDIALLSGADGVHLGQSDLPCERVREMIGRQLMIGVSTSNLAQAQQALLDGADYCGIGPMFPTATKHKESISGPAYLREYLRWNRLPHLTIGGISPQNIDQLVEAGCRGVAVSSAVCTADDPGAVVAALRDALDSARTMP